MNRFKNGNWLVVLALGLAGFFLMGSGSSDVSGQEARALVKKGALLLDVRTPKEFADKHLDGALNIPHDELPSRLEALKDKKNADIVVYCHSGRRSALAVKTLREAGFTKVHDLGAMANW